MVRKRVFTTAFIVVCIALIISLIFNSVYSKRMNREHQYSQLLTNQLIFYVSMSANNLGAINHAIDYERAAIDMADAANALNYFNGYESVVRMNNSSQVGDIANYMSYVSLAFVNQNEKYLVNNKMITIDRKQGRDFVLRMNHILETNMKNSNIPLDKATTIFNQIYKLIPHDIRTKTGILQFFNF